MCAVTALFAAGCVGNPGGSATSTPVAIDYQGDPGWVRYANTDLHFSISTPVDWEILSVTKSVLAKKTTMNLTLAMNRVVFACAPNMTGCVMISGMDYSGEPVSPDNDFGDPWIPDNRYEEFLVNAESATFEGIDVTITGITKDSNNYLINGHPARHASFIVQINGESQTTDCYIIAHNNAYYSEWYAARPGSTTFEAATASDIMHTFDIAI